jgi:hypothetical protein
MTIPATVYEADKVADDLKASKKTINTNAILERAIKEGHARGKGFISQVAEYLRLLRSPGGLNFPDYYVYRLFEDSQLTFADKQRFVSDRFYFKIIDKCCDQRWWILVDDKFWAETALRANGFPVTETQAVFCEADREFGLLPTMHDVDALEHYLRHDARFPVYSKPINGIGSFGNFLIDGFEDKSVLLHDGTQLPVRDFAEKIERSVGQLFQTTLQSHPDLDNVCRRVSTVRVILIIQDNKVKFLNTVWKVPRGGNIADNFWREGNGLGSVDPMTGVVERAVGYVNQVPEVIEPESELGRALVGRKLPDWDEVIDICRRGARLFAPLKFQGWDIGLTNAGPVVVEVNPGSSFILSQVASGKGFLTDEFHRFVVECGYPLKPFK